ncbi:response regulator [Synergistales bacterium]|nr:response regulator [Synergistales bacterium]
MKTIFVVDDNETNRIAAKEALDASYKTYAMPSAERMFSLLDKLTPDLILLDIEMPETDGFTALRRLKANERHRSIPVIFLTASSDEKSEVRGFEMGAVDFVGKPFSRPILLKRLETHIGIDAIVKQRTFEVEQSRASIDKLKNGIISVIADVIEGRDKETGGHIARTQKYLEILLREMSKAGVYVGRFSDWDLPVVLPSAQLHDIGKITVSDVILNKPGKLSDEEFTAMKAHAAEGERLIEQIAAEVGVENADFLRHAKLFAGTHHEKWNGKGYPRGLSGEDIPLEGRVMAIADVYDALTSARVYKPAFTHGHAVEIIKSDSSIHFDPKLVEVFLEAEGEFCVAGVV